MRQRRRVPFGIVRLRISFGGLHLRIFVEMALVGTRVERIREGDTNMAIKTEVVADTETGLLLERKTIVAEVQTEDGQTAIIAGQKTSVAAIQVKIHYMLVCQFVEAHVLIGRLLTFRSATRRISRRL